jgi:hypothetical protein
VPNQQWGKCDPSLHKRMNSKTITDQLSLSGADRSIDLDFVPERSKKKQKKKKAGKKKSIIFSSQQI